MPIIEACCCWDNQLKTGSRMAAVFTMVTAVINIIIGIWALVNLHFLDTHLLPHEKENFLPPGVIPLTYILFAINFAMLGLGFVLLVGINRGYEGKKFIWAWILCMFSFGIFDIFIGTYVVAWLGGHRIDDIIFVTPELIVVVAYWLLDSIFMDIIFVTPELIVVVAYWLVDTLILVAALLCVVSYWQQLSNQVHRKSDRAKHFQRLSKARGPPRSFGGRTPGTRTPSYWTASRSTLMVSHEPLPHKY